MKNSEIKATHTFDIVIHYYSCPKCGYIGENRKNFIYRFGVLQKELECERCRHQFIITQLIYP